MDPRTGNLFAGLPPHPPPDERFDELCRTAGLRVERIVSWGHTTAAGEWFDQETDEWVVLLTGAARLRIEGRAELLFMRPGDWVFLPARVRHQVEWTDPVGRTVWLAVHAVAE
ncbi:MAG TPA: cupin [Gemmataceae bacterium]|nr:cupin [Gemmataceae bacterium]